MSTIPLVVGLGSPLVGDDAVGEQVVRTVAGWSLDVDVEVTTDPLSLLDLWAQRPLVVVVDAVLDHGPPGRVVTIDQRELSAAKQFWGARGSHGWGLPETVALATRLGLLPQRLVVVGVTAQQLQGPPGLSPEVAAAVPKAAEVVTNLLGLDRGGDPDADPELGVQPGPETSVHRLA